MPEDQRINDRFLRLHPELFQKILLLATIKSFRFFRATRDVLCPMEEARKGRRPDFLSPDFNKIYSIVADYWSAWEGTMDPLTDHALSLDKLEELLHSEIEGGRLAQEEAVRLFDALKQDYEALDFDPVFVTRLPRNPVVIQWLDKRAAVNIVDHLYKQRTLRATTLGELKQMVMTAQASMGRSVDRVVRAADLMFGKSTSFRAFDTDLPLLNAATGGGFRPKTTTLVAGINGGGKTILACQWAKHYAMNGAKVVVVTTEQPPEQLLQRMVCNHLQVGLNRFMSPVGVEELPMTQRRFVEGETLTIPNDVYAEHEEAVTNFYYKIWPNLFFVDWSGGGMSVYNDFEVEMEKITVAGWDPDVIIFDWIGGGLDSPRSTGAAKMDLRLLYKEAIEILITHGKRTNRVMIAFAQLNKSLIGPRKKAVLMSDLAECKSMTDNVTNFIGISALQNLDSTQQKDGVTSTLLSRQYLNVDKARMGPKGLVPVDIAFRVQAFQPAAMSSLLRQQ